MSSSLSKAEALKIYEFKRFCHKVNLPPKVVELLLAKMDSIYQKWTKDKTDKKTGKVKTYKDGTTKTRTFRNPSDLLKVVQSKIRKNILSQIKLPLAVHGGVKHRSNITNAKPHQGNKFIFTTDLQDFYPNISSADVYGSLRKIKFSSHFSRLITKFTTTEYELPQGAPTSTDISNIVFLETDLKLIAFCNQHGIVYTRYIDDLSFSAPKDFRPLLNEILEIIRSAGFHINYRKTAYTGEQTITGIQVFLNKIDAPEKVIVASKNEILSQSPKKPYTIYLNNIRKTNPRKKKPATNSVQLRQPDRGSIM